MRRPSRRVRAPRGAGYAAAASEAGLTDRSCQAVVRPAAGPKSAWHAFQQRQEPLLPRA